jgi:hypothetical protein
MVVMNTPPSFNRRTVDLLVSIDPGNSDPGEGFYLTRAGKLLGKADTKAIRSASPADHAQARLILAARRDAALARYEDKRQLLNDLLHPYDDGHSPIEEIVGQMMEDEHDEAVAIASRLAAQPEAPPADIEDAVSRIHLLARAGLRVKAFADSDRPQPQKDEAHTLARMIEASRALLTGEPVAARITITAEEAEAKLADLEERYPAFPDTGSGEA